MEDLEPVNNNAINNKNASNNLCFIFLLFSGEIIIINIDDIAAPAM